MKYETDPSSECMRTKVLRTTVIKNDVSDSCCERAYQVNGVRRLTLFGLRGVSEPSNGVVAIRGNDRKHLPREITGKHARQQSRTTGSRASGSQEEHPDHKGPQRRPWEARTGEKPAVREHRKENTRKTQSKDSKDVGAPGGHTEHKGPYRASGRRKTPRGLSACLRKQAGAQRDSTKARTGTNEILAMLTAPYLPRPAFAFSLEKVLPSSRPLNDLIVL